MTRLLGAIAALTTLTLLACGGHGSKSGGGAQTAAGSSPASPPASTAPVGTRAPLRVSTAGLPNGQVGVSYAAPLAAADGISPYTWQVAAGALPAGLALDPATGALSGTPAAAGTSSFTARVTDARQSVADATLSIVIQLGVGTWADLAAPRLSQPLSGAACAAYNGQLFLFGGQLGPGVFSDKIYRYDPAQGTVVEEATILPTTRLGSGRAHAAAVTVGTSVWVFGGSTVGGSTGGPYGELMEFVPAVGALFTQGVMPEARFGMAAAAVGTKVYLFGGSTIDFAVRPAAYRPQTQIWEFDTLTRTFLTRTSVLPRPLVFARAAAVGGKVYLLGGSDGETTLVSGFPHTTPALSDQLYVYDPATDTIGAAAPLPSGRQAAVVAELNGQLYAISGDTTTGLHDAAAPWTRFTTETLTYDPQADSWRAMAPIETRDPVLGALGGRSHASGAVVGGRVYVLGGFTLPAPGATAPTSQGLSDLISHFQP